MLLKFIGDTVFTKQYIPSASQLYEITRFLSIKSRAGQNQRWANSSGTRIEVCLNIPKRSVIKYQDKTGRNMQGGNMSNRFGWTGAFLEIDLTAGTVQKTSSTAYLHDFIGGRMLAARLYWDRVPAQVKALDPENVLMLMPGPLTGSPATACSRWVICAKSPHSYPDQYGFGNGGGRFGAEIKRAGYDGILITGKAPTLSYIEIEDDRVNIRDAAVLRGLATDDTMGKLKDLHGSSYRPVCIGPAGENQVRFAIVSSDQGSSFANGMGAVMGSKNLKAVVIRGSQKVGVANPEKLKKINKKIRHFREGQNESLYLTEPMIQGIDKTRSTPCYGCPGGCMRAYFRHTSGREEIRQTCASAFMYLPWDQKYSGESTENTFLATSLCDRYGLCTGEVSNLLHWLNACHEKGLLTEDETGLLLSKIGSREFIEKMIDRIVHQKDFGALLAEGTRRAAIEKGREAEETALEHIRPSGYVADAYGGRLFFTNALFYATENRNPIIQLHEFSFTLLKWMLWHTTSGSMSNLSTENLRKIAELAWGSEKAVDFSTCAGKARAAFTIQNRQHIKESMVACDRFYPLLETDKTEDGVGDPSFVPQMFSAVTGREMSMEDYLRAGERSMNLQRAIAGREGKIGRKYDTINEFNFTEGRETEEGMIGLFNPDLEFPGPGDEIVSRKGKVLERSDFEQMKDEYYTFRNWDVNTGLQNKESLNDLNLSFVTEELEKKGFLK